MDEILGKPSWEYKLWRDDGVKEMALYNQKLYDQSSNYGEKSDYVPWEYGGLYVDVDYECIKLEIFDGLHKSFDFYIGFEQIEHGLIYAMYKTCNALVGAAPSYLLILDFMEHMDENINIKQLWKKQGLIIYHA